MTRLQYGVERNGEHGKIFDNYDMAESYIVFRKELDEQQEQMGWTSPGSAATVQYRIVELTPRRLAQGW